MKTPRRDQQASEISFVASYLRVLDVTGFKEPWFLKVKENAAKLQRRRDIARRAARARWDKR